MRLSIPASIVVFLLFSYPASITTASDPAVIQLNQDRIEASPGMVSLYRQDDIALKLGNIRFDYQDPLSWSVSQRSNDLIEMTLEYPVTVDFNHHAEDRSPRSVTVSIARVNGGFRFFANPKWADQITLELEYLGDHFFGLSSPLQPDNRLSPDLTGTEISVEVTNEGENIVENYASAFSAFYLSSQGYGSFFDTFARGRYAFGINGKNRIHHDTGKLDWYLFPGDDGVVIHRAYFELIGQPKRVPLWGLGPIAWRDQNNGGAEEILSDIQNFTELELPVTAWFVDRPYSDGAHAWSQMNFSEKFAHPEKWISQIRDEYGLEFMTWTATAMFGDTNFPRHLNGDFTYLDLSHPETVAAYQQKLVEQQYAFGVKGHKMDRADEHFPPWENWFDNSVRVPERRNRYAYLFNRIHHDALQQAWGDDQLNFARAAIHRIQPFTSAIWGGDPRSNWAGLQGNAANAIRASLMGFPVWGSDVGGYQGEGYIPEDLYLRWLGFGVVSGMLEIKLDGAGGSGRDRMPWSYDEAFQEHFRTLLNLRMKMLPYLYSLANNAANTGTIMQPMVYRHPNDPETWDIWDQFYVGPSLLAAPVLEPGLERRVYLPEGKWIRMDGGKSELLEGGKWHTVHAELQEIPLFMPANSILVLGNYEVGNRSAWSQEEEYLKIKIAAGDDGDTSIFTYIDPFDSNAEKVVKIKREGDLLHIHAPALGLPSEWSVILPGRPETEGRIESWDGDKPVDIMKGLNDL